MTSHKDRVKALNKKLEALKAQQINTGKSLTKTKQKNSTKRTTKTKVTTTLASTLAHQKTKVSQKVIQLGQNTQAKLKKASKIQVPKLNTKPLHIFIFVLFILGTAFFIKDPSITGLVIFDQQHAISLNTTYNQTTVELLELKDIPTSIKISGQMQGELAKVLLKTANQSLTILEANQEGFFADACLQTCAISDLEGEAVLEIITQNATITIDQLTYTTQEENLAPKWTALITDFKLRPGTPLSINLSNYVADPENDNLTYLITMEDEYVQAQVSDTILTFSTNDTYLETYDATLIVADPYQIARINLTVEVYPGANPLENAPSQVDQKIMNQLDLIPEARVLVQFKDEFLQELNAENSRLLEEPESQQDDPENAEEILEENQTQIIQEYVKAKQRAFEEEFSDLLDDKKNFSLFAGIAATLSQEQIEHIANSKQVKALYLDEKWKTTRTDSMPLINVPQTHSVQLNGTNITGQGQAICVVDTGIDNSHDEFQNRISNQYCYCSITDQGNGGCCPSDTTEDTSAEDDESHGSHVTGIAAGTSGVAPGADIVSIKACNSNGDCGISDVILALEYCIANKDALNISVISASIGDQDSHTNASCPTFLDTTLQAGQNLGLAQFFAAGNNGHQSGVNYPACAPSVIAVGATTKQDSIASYSNIGDTLDLLAPGSNIVSTIPTNGHQEKSGTSMATPHASGAALLLFQQAKIRNLNITGEDVRSILTQTGVSVQGYPRLDVEAAVLAAITEYEINETKDTVEADYAGIDFGPDVNMTRIEACTQLLPNRIMLDSEKCPEYNHSATLMFKQVTLPPPIVVYLNNETCPPDVCTGLSIIGTNVTVNVTHFSEFSLQSNGSGSFSTSALGNLSCVLRNDTTSCLANETKMIGLSNFTNAHAEFANQSNYNYSVCCIDLNGANTLSTDTGFNFLDISNSTNAHVELPDETNYPNQLRIGASADDVACQYPDSFGTCMGVFTCLMTVSTNETMNTSNLAAGSCDQNPFQTSVCCGFVDFANVSNTFCTPDAVNVTNTTTCNATVQAAGGIRNIFANVTLINGTTFETNLTNDSNVFSFNFSNTELVSTATISWIVNDSTALTTIVQDTFDIADPIAPNVTADTCSPFFSPQNNPVLCNATVTDNYAIGNVTLNITFPNLSTTTFAVENDSEIFFNNFTDTEQFGLYRARWFVNDTGNLSDFANRFFFVVFSCGEINDSIVLQNNVSSSSGSCFDVTAQKNITFDCNGNQIVGDGTGNGFNLNGSENITIKNCDIQNFDTGIRINGSSNILLLNNSINGSGSKGVAILGDDNILENNTFLLNPTGVDIESGTNNTLFFNNFTSSSIVAVNAQTTGNNLSITRVLDSGTVQLGNSYEGMSLINISDFNIDGFGERGSNYPYNATNAGNISGPIQDFGPIVAPNSTFNNSRIINSTKINSTILDAIVINSTNDISRITNGTETLVLMNQSTAHGSNTTFSRITNSSIIGSLIVNASIKNASVFNASMLNNSVIQSVIMNSSDDGSLIQFSVLVGTAGLGAFPFNTTINGTLFFNATQTFNETINSTIIASSIIDALIIDSIIDNATVNKSTLHQANLTLGAIVLNASINNSLVANATQKKNQTVNSTIRQSELIDAVVIGSTIDNSTVNQSRLDQATLTIDSRVFNATINNSVLMNTTQIENQTVNTSLQNTTAFNALLANTTTLNSSINQSQVFGSSVTDSEIINATLIQSIVSNVRKIINLTINSTLVRSFTLDSFITNSTVQDSSINKSLIFSSNITGSEIINATVNNSIYVNTTQIVNQSINSTIVNTSIIDSQIINSTVSDSIINTTLLYGTNASGARPFNTTLNHTIFVNSTQELNRTINATVINSTIRNSFVVNSTLDNNATVIDTDMFSVEVLDGSFTASTIRDVNTSNSSYFNVTALNSSISDSTITFSTIIAMDIARSNITFSSPQNANATGSTLINLSNITNSILLETNQTFNITVNSTAENSSLFASTIINSSVKDSTITNSSLRSVDARRTNTVNTTLLNVMISNATFINTTATNSSINDTSAKDAFIINSTIDPTNLTGSIINNSFINDSIINYSVIINSTIVNTTVVNSTIINSIKINSILIDSNISNSNNTNSTLINATESLCNVFNVTLVNSSCFNETRVGNNKFPFLNKSIPNIILNEGENVPNFANLNEHFVDLEGNNFTFDSFGDQFNLLTIISDEVLRVDAPPDRIGTFEVFVLAEDGIGQQVLSNGFRVTINEVPGVSAPPLGGGTSDTPAPPAPPPSPTTVSTASPGASSIGLSRTAVQNTGITCGFVTKRSSVEEVVSRPTRLTPGTLLPEGTSQAISPFALNCEQDDLDLTLSVPDNFIDLQALRCRGTNCVPINDVELDLEDLRCGNYNISEIRRQQQEQARKVAFEPPELLSKLGKVLDQEDNEIDLGQYRLIANLSNETRWMRMSTPNFTINEPTNPSLRIISVPIIVETNTSINNSLPVNLTLPYSNITGFDNTSLQIYSYVQGKWETIGGVQNASAQTVTATIEDLRNYTDQDNTAVFGILGIACPTCVKAQFKKVYDPGSRNAIVLVHGLLSSPLTWQLLIDDFSLNSEKWQMWTFGYESKRSIQEIARDLQTELELNSGQYDTVYLVGHSLGGLVSEEAVASAYRQSLQGAQQYSFLPKVRKLITIGSPHKGSPAAAVYDNFFRNLVTQEGITVSGGASTELLTQLEDGHQAERVPGIKYYVIAGTRPYEFNLGLFKVTTEEILNLTEENDGITSVRSAQFVGGEYINNNCDDYFEVNLTHTDLLDHPVPRKVMSRIINEDITVQETEKATVGFNQYMRVQIPECTSDETYVVVGKKIDPLAAKSVLGCGCGNGVCGVDESIDTCPQDCAQVEIVSPFEKYIYWGSRIILGLLFVILFLLAYRLYETRKEYGKMNLLTPKGKSSKQPPKIIGVQQTTSQQPPKPQSPRLPRIHRGPALMPWLKIPKKKLHFIKPKSTLEKARLAKNESNELIFALNKRPKQKQPVAKKTQPSLWSIFKHKIIVMQITYQKKMQQRLVQKQKDQEQKRKKAKEKEIQKAKQLAEEQKKKQAEQKKAEDKQKKQSKDQKKSSKKRFWQHVAKEDKPKKPIIAPLKKPKRKLSLPVHKRIVALHKKLQSMDNEPARIDPLPKEAYKQYANKKIDYKPLVMPKFKPLVIPKEKREPSVKRVPITKPKPTKRQVSQKVQRPKVQKQVIKVQKKQWVNKQVSMPSKRASLRGIGKGWFTNLSVPKQQKAPIKAYSKPKPQQKEAASIEDLQRNLDDISKRLKKIRKLNKKDR